MVETVLDNLRPERRPALALRQATRRDRIHETEHPMNTIAEKPGHEAIIASHIDGRLRLRLNSEDRHPKVMARLKRNLEKQAGVHSVEINPVTGSVKVLYDEARHDKAAMLEILKDVDVVVTSVTGLPHVAKTMSALNGSTLTFHRAIDELNDYLAALTGITIRYDYALPIILLLAGLWSLRKNQPLFGIVPSWLLLWLAFDLFMKLRTDTSPTQELMAPLVKPTEA